MDEQWIPHERSAWPWRIASLNRDCRFEIYQGYWQDNAPVMIQKTIPAGTKVKIVMVSRFGDVGITDDLTAEFGYHARVSFDDLTKVEESCAVPAVQG